MHKWLHWRYRKKQKEWEEFQKNLQVADIILVRNKYRLISRLISKFTKSYWSHVALVFAVPNKKLHFNNYLIIEANDTGLEIHRIHVYSKYFHKYDLGVKRVPNLTPEMRQRVINFMLNNVDQPYDPKRFLGFLIKMFDVDLFKNYSELFVNKEDFICSSFVQKAFLDAMPDSKKHLVDFTDEKTDDYEFVSPADIAKSKNCVWIYNERY